MARTVSRVVSLACTLAVLAALLLAGAPSTYAQSWTVGASYQLRAGPPGQGAGVQVQRLVLLGASGPGVLVRGSATYFPRQTERFVTDDYGQTTQARSYGAALGAVLTGRHERFRPYFGADGGYERRTGSEREGGFNWGPRFTAIDARGFYLAPVVGASLEVFGGVRPYVEYVHPVYLGEEVFSANVGRLAAGVSIQF